MTATLRDDSITDAGSRICLRKAVSSVPGIDNALAEFVQGRRIPIPEKHASPLVRIKRVLLQLRRASASGGAERKAPQKSAPFSPAASFPCTTFVLAFPHGHTTLLSEHNRRRMA